MIKGMNFLHWGTQGFYKLAITKLVKNAQATGHHDDAGAELGSNDSMFFDQLIIDAIGLKHVC